MSEHAQHANIGTRRQPPRDLMYNLLLEAELSSIVRALHAREIPVLVLKGIPLTRQLHGRLDARQMVDNDLLVKRSHVTQAARCLTELGYSQRPHHTLAGDLRSDFQSALFKTTPTGGRVWVELHWSAFPPKMFRVPEPLQWARTQPFALRSGSVLIFDPAMCLVHLASHFVQHHCSQPRILRDVAAAWNRWHAQLDLEDLATLARETEVYDALSYSLQAASELGWLSVPGPVLRSRKATYLMSLLPSQRLLDVEVSRYARTLLTTLLLNPRRVPGWLLDRAAPPLDRMAAVYERPVSRWLYLRYPTRPFRAVKRLLLGKDREPTR